MEFQFQGSAPGQVFVKGGDAVASHGAKKTPKYEFQIIHQCAALQLQPQVYV